MTAAALTLSAHARIEWPTAVVESSATGNAASYDGTVEAIRQAVLAAQVPGAVVALQVKAGDTVQAGQTLARIDARAAEQGAAASAAQVTAARAALDVAAQELARKRALFQKNYIAKAALEQAEAQYRSAQAQVNAQVAQAGAARTQTGFHVVTAPFDGVVSAVLVERGDMAMPGRPLLSLYDPAALRLTAQLTQDQARQLRSGVQVEIPGLTVQRLSIAASQIQLLPTADPLSHTVAVRVQLPANQQGAMPGMFARLWWQGDAADAAQRVLIPSTAVVRRAEMTGVYVQGDNGKPQLRQVRLGLPQGDMVEVLSGLRVGDQVAVEPQAAARVR